MDCKKVRELAIDLSVGELKGLDALKLRWHLLRCGSCRREYLAQRRLWREVRELFPERVPQVDLREEVPERGRWCLSFPWRWLAPVAVAAALLLMVLRPPFGGGEAESVVPFWDEVQWRAVSLLEDEDIDELFRSYISGTEERRLQEVIMELLEDYTGKSGIS